MLSACSLALHSLVADAVAPAVGTACVHRLLLCVQRGDGEARLQADALAALRVALQHPGAVSPRMPAP